MRRPSERLLAVGVLLSGLLWSRGLLSKEPCDKGTFREAPWQKCVPCDLCDGDHREYERPCSQTANAVCRCRAGYCGRTCQRCPCPAGQMWTPQGCQNCSRGEFDNRSGGPCSPGTRSSESIQTPGTDKTDVDWRRTTTTPPRVVSTNLHPSEADPGLGAVSAALVGALLLCLALIFISCIFLSWAKEKFWKGPQRQPVQEVDYRYPEEEKGGDSDPPCLKRELHLLEKVP